MKLFDLAWPIFIETALFMLLGFVDVFILSGYNDLAASAVNTAGQAVSVVTLVFTVISGASAVLISQYLGADKKTDASRIAALSIVLNIISGIIISVVFTFLSGVILSGMGADGDVLKFSSQYLSIVGSTIFLQAFMNAVSVIIRNHGYTRLTMYVTVGINILNAGLDYILVQGLFGVPALGVAGAAWATVFSRFVGAAVMSAVLFTKIEKLSIFKLIFPLPLKDIADIIKIGLPSAMETFLYNLSQVVITSIVLTYLTDTELITKTYVQDISMFFYIFAVAIGQASQIITGHNVGAGEMDKAYRDGLKAYHYALGCTLAMCSVGIFFRSQLLGIFTDDENVIALGSTVIVVNLLLELGRTTNIVVIAQLRGAGDVYFPTICAIFSMWLISVLGAYILAVRLNMGIYGLWAGITADECIRGILMVIRWRSKKWQSKAVVNQNGGKKNEQVSSDPQVEL